MEKLKTQINDQQKNISNIKIKNLQNTTNQINEMKNNMFKMNNISIETLKRSLHQTSNHKDFDFVKQTTTKKRKLCHQQK